MSTVKTNNVQVGQSGTATNNFTLYQPTSPDGTVRLGVGNSGATTADAFVVNSSSRAGLGTTTLSSISGTVSTLSIGGTNASTSGGIAYQTNGTVKGYHYIDSDVMTHQSVSAGHKFLANNVTSVLAVGAGTTVVLQGGSSSSGTGIAFPATQSASSNANTLDDYEEGTWTPNVGGNATYTTQYGTYVKIGRTVYISARIVINTIGTGSTTYIFGLPFAQSSIAESAFITCGYFSGLASSVLYVVGAIGNSGSQIEFNYNNTSGTTFTGYTLAAMTSGTRIDVSGVYTTST